MSTRSIFLRRSSRTSRARLGAIMMALAVPAACVITASAPRALAQAAEGAAGSWQAEVGGRGGKAGEGTAGQQATPSMTVIPRGSADGKAPPQAGASGQVSVSALITADGQPIQQGLTWRVYQDTGEGEAKSRLLSTHKEASPSLRLAPGTYFINAAFGRANLTRKIVVAAGQQTAEQFILNAGGLKLAAVLEKDQPAPANAVVYDIFSDDRDQFGNRAKIMSGAKPGLIIRLNAGIYQIASTYGDANATVLADVTVEAGKLTVATIKHTAARVTFKLVTKVGGEALPDTQWVLHTRQGQPVKESVGALPNHIIAPGAYTIIAKNGARTYKRDFAVQAGDVAQVEVVIQ